MSEATNVAEPTEGVKVLWYYEADKNPGESFYGSVPLANLDEAMFNDLPLHLQRSVAGSPFYRAGPGVRKAWDEAEAQRSAEAERQAAVQKE